MGVRMPRLTLRRRLIIITAALLAAVILAVGLASVLALRSFMVDRLDAQLSAVSGRTANAIGGPQGGDDGPRPPAASLVVIPGQGAGTLVGMATADGRIGTAAVLTDDINAMLLTNAELARLDGVPLSADPVTVDLGGTLGSYRVVVDITERGDALLVGLPLAEVDATVWRLTLIVFGFGLAGLTAAGIASLLLVRRALRPLDRVAETATRVSGLQLERGEVELAERVAAVDADPTTEVGRVGSAFNGMLDHVAAALAARQASENKVRTFVADASHELRTPLASVRGYAELTRRGGHDLPPDVVRSLARIESEALRMTALVEDLLLLARLDEGDRLETMPVDLVELVVDATGDAAVAASDHDISVRVPDGPVTVSGDPSRLHQVVANLLSNAVKHTPAGTAVEASLAIDGGHAVIVVADDGPGIAPELLPTIFDRFARGDGSRSRAAGSTGLGLAIVAALVAVHGATITAESVPGDTRFTVRMPLA